MSRSSWSWADVQPAADPMEPEPRDERSEIASFLRRRADEMVQAAIREKGPRHPVRDQAERTAAAYRQAATEIEET